MLPAKRHLRAADTELIQIFFDEPKAVFAPESSSRPAGGHRLESPSRTFNRKSFERPIEIPQSVVSVVIPTHFKSIGFVQFANYIYPVKSTQSFANGTNSIFIVQPCPIRDLQTTG